MKYFWLIIAIFTLVQCAPQSKNKQTSNTEIKPEKNEEDKWELTVIDPQFDYFMNAHAKPMSYYSEEVLKARNTTMVAEWNSYFLSGRYRNIIESQIDYDPRENYGLEFEYKLYNVFAYVSWRYGLKLAGLSGADTF